MVNKVFFSAKTQYENLGDGVISCQLLKRMRVHGCVLVDNRTSPEWYDAVLGLHHQESARLIGGGFKRKLLKSAIQSLFLSSSVYLVLKPGHIFGGRSLIKEIIYTTSLFCLWLMRIRIVRYGASIGPFDKNNEPFEKIKALCFWDYTARDGRSLNYCKSLGISRARYYPDMAFGLDYYNDDCNRKYSLALSFRTGTTSEHERAYVEKLECHLTSSKWVEIKLTSVLFVSQVLRDDLYMQNLRDKLAPSANFLAYTQGITSHDEIFRRYESVEIALSNRLHVLLFSASRGAIPVPIIDREKHLKITGLFETVGLEDLIFDILDETSLDEHFDYINKNAEEIKGRIALIFSSQFSNI